MCSMRYFQALFTLPSWCALAEFSILVLQESLILQGNSSGQILMRGDNSQLAGAPALFRAYIEYPTQTQT